MRKWLGMCTSCSDCVHGGKKGEHSTDITSWRTCLEHTTKQRGTVQFAGSIASPRLAPPNMAPTLRLSSSPATASGNQYTSALDLQLLSFGKQLLEATSDFGSATRVLFQVADVSRHLATVSPICEIRSRVNCCRGGGVIRNVTAGR